MPSTIVPLIYPGAQRARSHHELERQLLAALRPPHDLPLVEQVTIAAHEAIHRYARSLPSPAVVELLALEGDLDELVRPLRCEFGVPTTALYRRLSHHPAYALLLDLAANPAAPDWIRLGTGAALAEAILVTGRPMRSAFADRMRRAMERGMARVEDADGATRRIVAALHRRVDPLLSAEGVPAEHRSELPGLIAGHYRALLRFTGERRRQGVQDRASLSGAAFVAASHQLREAVETGEDVAFLAVTSALTGLPPALARRVPVLDTITDDWVAALDATRGLFLLDLEVIAPHAAGAPVGVDGLVAAARVLVRPLPEFFAEALRARLDRDAAPSSVDDLLPNAYADGRTLVVRGDGALRGFQPSLARYLATIESEMIRIGIDRLCAAHLSGRYQGIPHAGLYYGLVHRDELWGAAERWYNHIGWGAPVPIAEGLPVGARGTPTLEGLTAWYTAMAAHVHALAPGRRYRLDSLLAHHNAYARLVASLAILLLASRNRDPIPLSADAVAPTRSWARFGDKYVSAAHSPGPQPVCPTLMRQFELWQHHCRALAARLRRCAADATEVIMHLDGIARGASVPALIEIVRHPDGLQTRALGGSDLAASWPAGSRYAANLGRAFWYQALRRHGVAGREIDAFARHQVPGRRPQSSTDDRILAETIARVVRVQERVLAECSIRPVQGLAR